MVKINGANDVLRSTPSDSYTFALESNAFEFNLASLRARVFNSTFIEHRGFLRVLNNH